MDERTLERLKVVSDRMRQQVFDAGSTVRIHEEDVLEVARLVDRLHKEVRGGDHTDSEKA